MDVSKRLERTTAKDLGNRIDKAIEELAATARQLARVSQYLQKDGNAQWTEVARLAGNISDTIEMLQE